MFQIKICGITNVDDALAAVTAGADAVGLNFYAKSPRHVDTATARRIVAALPAGVTKVGVFVDAAVDEMAPLADELGLALIQLHGGEPPGVIRQLAGRPVMRAFRLGNLGLGPIDQYLDRCRADGCLPRCVLLDAMVEGQFGGTGRTTDWAAAARYRATHEYPGLVLAGGLTPRNVAEAIRAVLPQAVDTASGVESSPGRKDHAAMLAFVQAARSALTHRQPLL